MDGRDSRARAYLALGYVVNAGTSLCSHPFLTAITMYITTTFGVCIIFGLVAAISSITWYLF